MERPAFSLDVLLRQINARWPERSRASDGWIGDRRHAAISSDHNPNADGVVCARDFTNDPAHGLFARKVAQKLIDSKDPRIKYVISDGEICSGIGASHPAWVWRPYTGSNRHNKHFHISVRSPAILYDSIEPWHLDGAMPGPDLARIGTTLWIQQKLNLLGKAPPLTEDGNPGPKTTAAILAFAVACIQEKLKPNP